MPKLNIYFDNSSWNQLANGLMQAFRNVVAENNMVVCYSQDNLQEILSTDCNVKRASLEAQLDKLSAQFIENLGESTNGLPYKALFKSIDSKERRRIYRDATPYTPVGGFGLSDMLQKMIGGIQSKSYDAIFQEALGNMESMLDTAIDDLDDGIERDLCILRKRIILQDANSAIDDFQYQVAKHEDLRLPEVDHVKVANFSGKGAAEKVFNEAEKSGAFETVRAFLSDVPIMRNEAHEVQMERDKILRVTQTLFFLRYKRETKNMKDSERARADFQGSLTDLEHIANASVCSVFHTSDKAQAAIAAATYDHLNIPTAVAHFSIKDDVTTFIHLPSQISAILDS